MGLVCRSERGRESRARHNTAVQEKGPHYATRWWHGTSADLDPQILVLDNKPVLPSASTAPHEQRVEGCVSAERIHQAVHGAQHQVKRSVICDHGVP
jgi:hypothetical protein